MKRILTLVLMMAAASQVKAQDPEYTQFYANPIYLNPAFAGTAAGPRFALNYRMQWPSISGAFHTYSASYDQHFDGLGGGIGAQVWYDRAGDGRLATKYVSGVYSYHLSVKDASRDYFIVKAGIQVSAFQRSVDFEKFHWGDRIHPRWGLDYYPATAEKLPSQGFYQTAWRPDFSIGALAFTKKYYGGFAISHLIEPQQSFFNNPESRLPRKFTAHMGMLLPVDNWKRTPETFISPNLLIQRQAKFMQFNMGAYGIKGPFILGMWYRHTDPNADALMLLAGAKKDAVKIGYSYDLTVSDARAAVPGSHEVSIIVELKKYNPRQVRKWRKINCPDF